jgi:hypothetical protein
MKTKDHILETKKLSEKKSPAILMFKKDFIRIKILTQVNLRVKS